jgi:hypothetical protein
MTTNLAVIYPKSRGTRHLYRAEEIKDETGKITGKRGVPDGHEEFWYETSIDLKELAGLAAKAAKNASLKAKDGPLRVKILAKRRIA